MRIAKSFPSGLPVPLLLAVAVVPAVALLAPSAAQACGGFFCNQPGNPFDPPPVAQTGENVLFAVNASPAPGVPQIEAHIQIFYAGPVAKFSWVLPVDALPALDVGSDAVFTALDATTRPKFQVSYHDEGVCKPSIYPPILAGAAGGGPAPPGGPTTDKGAVDVAFRGAVGPYDASVIHSASSAALVDWLTTNGYYVSPDASSIIDTYVRENKYFVALRLLNGQGVQSIRPIILRFDASAPCIPLRLTAIAAISDLRVNLWVLNAHRTVPLNYLEIEINQAKLDWLGGAGNYDMLLKQAADEAGGNAFAAEYAGDATVMARQLWFDGKFNLPALRTATTPPAYIAQLGSQGFPRDAKLLALLEKYIPEPASLVAAGVAERDFYNQLATYWSSNQSEFAPFDPGAFTDELDTTIVAPLASAQALFDGYAYLTRLATFISPEEMTKDPIFVFNPDLGNVPVVRQADATFECGNMDFSRCTAPVRLRLPDGRTLRFLPSPTAPDTLCYGYPAAYDRGDLASMPSLAVAWQRADSGEGTVVTSNVGTIGKAVADHNSRLGGGCGCSMGGGAGWAGLGGLAALGAALLRARRREERTRR